MIAMSVGERSGGRCKGSVRSVSDAATGRRVDGSPLNEVGRVYDNLLVPPHIGMTSKGSSHRRLGRRKPVIHVFMALLDGRQRRSADTSLLCSTLRFGIGLSNCRRLGSLCAAVWPSLSVGAHGQVYVSLNIIEYLPA